MKKKPKRRSFEALSLRAFKAKVILDKRKKPVRHKKIELET